MDGAMKPQLIKPRLIIGQHIPSFAFALGLFVSATALADDLPVNTFDSSISGIAWENWRSYVSGHSETWDPAQDVDGNLNSGSMYVTVNWPVRTDPNWNNNWNDVQIAFGAGSFPAA